MRHSWTRFIKRLGGILILFVTSALVTTVYLRLRLSVAQSPTIATVSTQTRVAQLQSRPNLNDQALVSPNAQTIHSRPAQNEVEIPQVRRQPTSSQPILGEHQSGELTIPTAFLGCWKSTKASNISSNRIGPPFAPCFPPSSRWYWITSKLCFKRSASGYEITYQAASSKAPKFRAHVDLVGSDGKTHVELRLTGTYSPGRPFIASFDFQDNCDFIRSSTRLACRETGVISCGLPVAAFKPRPWVRERLNGTFIPWR